MRRIEIDVYSRFYCIADTPYMLVVIIHTDDASVRRAAPVTFRVFGVATASVAAMIICLHRNAHVFNAQIQLNDRQVHSTVDRWPTLENRNSSK